MAPLPPVDGVAKVQFEFECSGRTFTDRVFFLNGIAEPWTTADLTVLATTAATSWQSRLLPFQDPQTTLEYVIATDLSSDTGLQYIHAVGSPGTFAGTAQLPLNCQARVTIQQPRRYRGGRPGFNITGLDRTELFDDRTIEPSVVTALQGAVFDMLFDDIPTADLSTGHPTCVVVSYQTGHAIRPIPLVTVPFGVEVQNRVCTLRKRLGKGEAG
jgi:hypothetical protein